MQRLSLTEDPAPARRRSVHRADRGELVFLSYHPWHSRIYIYIYMRFHSRWKDRYFQSLMGYRYNGSARLYPWLETVIMGLLTILYLPFTMN